MITITLHIFSVIIGVLIGLAAIGIVMIGSLYTGAWDNGFMEGYKVGKNGQTESCDRDNESSNSDTEKV